MSPGGPANVAASVHARLLRLAKRLNEDFNAVLVRFASERLLYHDAPSKAELPTLLDLPAPELRVYPVEALVAEKTEAMVRFGAINTRFKDYLDLYVLSTELTIDPGTLSR